MEVEYTARQVRISKALRTQAEEGMERIARILGKSARASIIFSAQKRQQIAEVTIQARLQTIAATGKADTLESALRLALEHAESQARRHRDRRMTSKRLPKEEKVLTAPPVARPKARAAQQDAEAAEAKPARARKKASTVIAVHSFPAGKTVVEPHIVSSQRGHCLEAHDHRGGGQRGRVPRPRPADLPQSHWRTVCAPSPPRRPDGAGGASLGSVHTTQVGGDGSQFFSDRGMRNDGYRVYQSDDGRRSGENWPRPFGLRRKSGHTSFSPSTVDPPQPSGSASSGRIFTRSATRRGSVIRP